MPIKWNQRLLDARGRLGLAISGGGDSTALLYLCAEAGVNGVVLHLNHGLRGEASDADEEFVTKLANQLGMACLAERVKVVRRKGESLEMAARRERLAFYHRATQRFHLGAIVTAHQSDDAMELFLMRLARGGGLAGLVGLKPESRIDSLLMLRPLLGCTAGELRGYLLEKGVAWCVDESNLDETIIRNRVRRKVLPYLVEQFGEAFRANFRRTLELLRGDNDLLEGLSVEAEGLASKDLGSKPVAIQRRVLQKRFAHLPYCERERLRLAGRLEPSGDPEPLVSWCIQHSDTSKVCRDNLMVATMRKVDFCQLVQRNWRPGDWIAPIGLSGRKKLQDIFTDLKVPRAQRQSLPIWAFGDSSEIAWVPGYRLAARLACQDGDDLIRIEVQQKKEL